MYKREKYGMMNLISRKSIFMKKLKLKEEQMLVRIILGFSIAVLIVVGVWIYMMYSSFQEITNFTDSTLQRYQSERVEMALARDYVESLITSTSTKVTHESRNGNTFFFQGNEESGAFMFVVEQTAPGQFELVNGVSSITIENAN